MVVEIIVCTWFMLELVENHKISKVKIMYNTSFTYRLSRSWWRYQMDTEVGRDLRVDDC